MVAAKCLDYRYRLRSIVFSAFVALFYAASCCATNVSDTSVAQVAPVTDEALMKVAQESVLTQLDEKAKTAQFRNTRVHAWHKRTVYLPESAQKDGYRAVCGEVRYKDDNNAFTSYIRFIYISQDSTIGVSSQDWAENCVN